MYAFNPNALMLMMWVAATDMSARASVVLRSVVVLLIMGIRWFSS
ncbi:MAG: hypothetical protein ACD_37C00166G0002 [uncultured bacterium]|nr:MAG: hypothetical protein ACD_37C00166G0002 [uncultured bacterium]